MVYTLTKPSKCGTWFSDRVRVSNCPLSVLASPGSAQSTPTPFLDVGMPCAVNTFVIRHSSGIVSLRTGLFDVVSRTEELTLTNLFEEVCPCVPVRNGKQLRRWINVVKLQIFRRTTNNTTTSKKLSGFTHPSMVLFKLVQPLLLFTVHSSSFGRDSTFHPYYSTM